MYVPTEKWASATGVANHISNWSGKTPTTKRAVLPANIPSPSLTCTWAAGKVSCCPSPT